MEKVLTWETENSKKRKRNRERDKEKAENGVIFFIKGTIVYVIILGNVISLSTVQDNNINIYNI